MRGGAVAARRAHNPKVAGSSPAPATNKTMMRSWSSYLISARCVQTLSRYEMSIYTTWVFRN